MAKNKKGKGKVQNGRAAQKGKAQKRASNFFIQDDDYEETQKNFRGFSGAQQRDTRAPRPENQKYRHLPMSFVSAGATGSAPPPPNDNADASVATTADPTHENEDLDSALDDEEGDDNIQTNILIDGHLNVDMDNMQIDASNSRGGSKNSKRAADMDDSRLEATIAANDAAMVEVEMEVDDEQPAFVVDTVGDSTLGATGFKLPVRRAVSPARSDSSEEVVMFSGRNNARGTVVSDPVAQTPYSHGQQRAVKQQAPSQPARQSSPHPTDDLLAALTQPTPASSNASPAPSTAAPQSAVPQYKNGWASRPSPLDASVRPANEWKPAPAVPYWKKQPNKPRPDLTSAAEVQAFADAPQRTSKVQFAESAAPASVEEPDIASLRANWNATLSSKKKAAKKDAGSDLDDELDSSAARTNRRGKRGRKKDNRNMRKAIDSEDDDSFGEAAYDDYMENLLAQAEAEDEAGDESNVLGSKFAFGSKSSGLGPSMVVDGKEIDEDELLPRSTKKIAKAEAARDAANDDDDDEEWESDDSSALHPDPDEVSSDEDLSLDLDSSDLEDEVEYSERQQWADEDDLRQRRQDRMTDEQIARLLAKQEEFGMEGDELLIEDDGAFPYTPEEGVGDVEAARVGLYNITNNSFIGAKPRRGRGDRKHNFPDATMLADTVDQYGEFGFDILDFERPSLRPTKKGRKKGTLPPELEMLSDEELKMTMEESWRGDRAKKAQKKLEREQLRREGLLGSAGRKGKADLNAKYPLGMTMVEVHHELKAFLLDEEVFERSFPPLAQVQRKALHEIAVALNLNSRSQGGGKNRFPVVYKTGRTQGYEADMFERIMKASGNGFLSRGKAKKIAKGKGVGGGGKGATGGGKGKPMMHVANGQIVGAGAAEIGMESMGHKLMMKMGWSKGQGLGKEGEGMKVPVEQKVRLGTAGLG